MLDVALSDQRGSEDVTGSVLTAVADVMLDRPDDALKELAKPQVGNQQDAPIWRAIAYARAGRWADAQTIFKDGECRHRRVADRTAAHGHAARRCDRRSRCATSTTPRKVANEFETVGVTARPGADDQRADRPALRGPWAATKTRSPAIAPPRLRMTAAPPRKAGCARSRCAFATGDMRRKDVINDLETLTTVWRGDETETEGLKMLAHLYTEDSRYRDAFHVMRTALIAHPNSDMTRKIQDEAAATFESLFLGGKAEALPPIEALGLFYDFRELTPIGRRGDEMIRRLADRLVSVDLLDQAAELLQHQVDHRLQGAARAQVATRLAVVYLMNRKPDRALATLQATRIVGSLQ